MKTKKEVTGGLMSYGIIALIGLNKMQITTQVFEFHDFWVDEKVEL